MTDHLFGPPVVRISSAHKAALALRTIPALLQAPLRRPSLPSDAPLISVVIATYNWSSVLRYAVASALRQTYPNIEVLVIGDGCTDDSAVVIESFEDPRVRWINLERNSGSQFASNNAGIAVARGRFIAYHGHDDIWLPTHLAVLAQAMVRAGADFGHTVAESMGPRGSNIRKLTGVMPGGRYDGNPWRAIPPSSLMHRRDAVHEIGWWRDHRKIDLPPDSEFTARAYSQGMRFVSVPALTVFKFNAGYRPGSYRDKPSAQQAAYFRRSDRERGFCYRELLAWGAARLLRRPERYPMIRKPPEPVPRGWWVREYRRVKGLE
jgi:glycosyltransferase involved in cell wall biosynthesis